MSNKTLKEYTQIRDEAVESNDLKKYKEFVKEAMLRGAITLDEYALFLNAGEHEQYGSMQKMALMINTISKERKEAAKKWLAENKMEIL